jgi:hypothetical protein
VESNMMILACSRKRRGWPLLSSVASVRGCPRVRAPSDYKFLACTGRTIFPSRPSTQICDSSNSSTQLPPPKLAQNEPFLF